MTLLPSRCGADIDSDLEYAIRRFADTLSLDTESKCLPVSKAEIPSTKAAVIVYVCDDEAIVVLFRLFEPDPERVGDQPRAWIPTIALFPELDKVIEI